MFIGLIVSLFAAGSCTKHVTQVVDQGFSAVYTVHPSDWTTDTYTGSSPLNQYAVVLSVPEIDDQIVANGGVMTYISFDGGATYDELPAEELGVSYNTLHWNSSLYIGFHTLNGTPPTLPNGDVTVKVVILDATPLD
jgi:hypothetical protein